MQGKHLVPAIGDRPIHPGNAIIWKVIQTLLAEIHDGAAHRCHCQYEQQRAGELSFKISQAAVSADLAKKKLSPRKRSRQEKALAK
jgi:hypothetical protein